ncbi:MAG: hypothetical protein ABIL39_02840 [candidate division WOR-3 bacterium]
MKKTNIKCITLIAITITLVSAEQSVEVGIKITRFATHCVTYYSEGYWNVDWWYEPYWGFNIEVLAGLVKNLYLRFEMIEARKYTGNGGTGFNIFYDLATDIEYFIPIGRKISPLVYAGIKYKRYDNKPFNDPRNGHIHHEYYLGSGITYRLNKQSKIILEIQLFNDFTIWREFAPTDMLYGGSGRTIGFGRANLGYRIKL